MKKIKILLTTLILSFVMVFAVGCGIEPDWNKASEEFKTKDYIVNLATDYDDIRFSLSCFNSYASPSKVDCVLDAKNNFEDELIFIFYCEDAATAEEIYEDIERDPYIKSGFAKTAGPSVSKDEVLCGCEDSIFYIGTRQAIKIAR